MPETRWQRLAGQLTAKPVQIPVLTLTSGWGDSAPDHAGTIRRALWLAQEDCVGGIVFYGTTGRGFQYGPAGVLQFLGELQSSSEVRGYRGQGGLVGLGLPTHDLEAAEQILAAAKGCVDYVLSTPPRDQRPCVRATWYERIAERAEAQGLAVLGYDIKTPDDLLYFPFDHQAFARTMTSCPNLLGVKLSYVEGDVSARELAGLLAFRKALVDVGGPALAAQAVIACGAGRFAVPMLKVGGANCLILGEANLGGVLMILNRIWDKLQDHFSPETGNYRGLPEASLLALHGLQGNLTEEINRIFAVGRRIGGENSPDTFRLGLAELCEKEDAETIPEEDLEVGGARDEGDQDPFADETLGQLPF